MSVAEDRIAAITSNLAGAQTPGFKRRATAVHGQQFGAVLGHTGAVARQVNDYGQGSLETTQQPLDLALMGPGFFEVESPEGPRFTRDGEFRLSLDGNLLSVEGYPVAWQGAAGQLDPAGDAILVDGEGRVLQDGREVGQLRIVQFDELEELRHTRDGYFVAPDGLNRIQAAPGGDGGVRVIQGALETSNVSPVEELVALITVQRSFEHAAELLRQIDQSYERLIQSR